MQNRKELNMPPKKDHKLIGFYADEGLQKKVDGFALTLGGAGFKARGKWSRKQPSRGDVLRFAVSYVIENVPLSAFLHFAEEQRKKEYPDRVLTEQLQLIKNE